MHNFSNDLPGTPLNLLFSTLPLPLFSSLPPSLPFPAKHDELEFIVRVSYLEIYKEVCT